MNVLLTYPEYPPSFFNFKHSLHFVSRKAALPPLGLITISTMMPNEWNKKLVDLNIQELLDSHLEWADLVFISAMLIQKDSVLRIIDQCQKHHVKIIAGGPLFTNETDQFPRIDHFILNEAEINFPPYLKDLRSQNVPKRIYKARQYANISDSPVPDFKLLNLKAYASMSLQVSRGCPHSCDFCEITSMLGHKVRIKKTKQVIKELDALYALKWRGTVSIVDDNFIGNKIEVKHHLLPAMTTWMREHRFPFIFNIQTTIALADDRELTALMLDAGINSTFIGIESPSETSLANSKKVQNRKRNLLQNVRDIQQAGMLVSGGFIVGFDSDTAAVFNEHIKFIQQSGIVWAMIGLLNAPKNTALYHRLEKEGRLTNEATGNNTDYSMNFIPQMNAEKLMEGYQSILHHTYAIKPYYVRVRQCLKNLTLKRRKLISIDRYYILAFVKSMLILGTNKKERSEYWKFLCWTLFNKPRLFLYAIVFTITGFHFRKIYGCQHTIDSGEITG